MEMRFNEHGMTYMLDEQYRRQELEQQDDHRGSSNRFDWQKCSVRAMLQPSSSENRIRGSPIKVGV
jgi:hypothetical protein